MPAALRTSIFQGGPDRFALPASPLAGALAVLVASVALGGCGDKPLPSLGHDGSAGDAPGNEVFPPS